MSRQVLILIFYLIFFGTDFMGAHLLIGITPHPGYRSLNVFAMLLSFLAYAIFLIFTPLFYAKVVPTPYWKGILWMLGAMTVAGFFIWLVFGDGHYSPTFYPYEFVCAGLWFGLVNAVFIAVLRFLKDFKIRHPKQSLN